jgi:hypothetical protein
VQHSDVASQTLDAFLKEAGLPPDAGTTGPNDWTIEKVLEEKTQYEASLVYEKVPGEDEDLGWSLPGEEYEFVCLFGSSLSDVTGSGGC